MKSYFQQFDNVKFTDIYPDVDTFLTDYNNSGIPAKIQQASASTLYYLLLSRHANSTLANYDHSQFKLNLFSIIFQYGPAWEKRLEIQDKLRSLSLEDNSEIYLGSKAIYNSAANPGTTPSTDDLDELPFINNQNTTRYKKSKLEGLSILNSLIETDVTEQFLRRFAVLFKKIILGRTLLYTTEE